MDMETALVDQGGDIAGVFGSAPYSICLSTIDGRPLRTKTGMVRMKGYESEAELMQALKHTGRE
jgi:hypothetical protein